MMRILLAAVVYFFISACGSGQAPVANSNAESSAEPSAPVVSVGPTPAELCQREIQLWQVQLADFRSREEQRQRSCSTLADRQIDLNDQYRRLRSEWAFTAPEYELCLRRDTQEERQRCLRTLCALIEIGGYRCADLQNPLDAIWDGQDQLFQEANQNCCSIAVESRLYSALNFTQPAPACSASLQPTQPACAQSTMGSPVSNASNAM